MTGVIISPSVVAVTSEGYSANNPLIGYNNLVTYGNISATSEDADYPVTNLANPSTAEVWKAVDASPVGDIYIEVNVNTVDPIDYIAIARHNLGTGLVPISVEGLVDNLSSPTEWVELCSDVLLPDDGPAMFCFDAQALYSIRIRLQSSSINTIPQIGVLYTGKLLVLQRRVYVGHTPITQGRSSNILNARSESGEFLGRITLAEWNSTSIALKNLTPTWVRQYLLPFIVDSRANPFFFAWRPSDYPYEVGFCWMTNDPRPINQLGNGMMQVSLEMTGIV